MELNYDTNLMQLSNGQELTVLENKILIALSSENIISNKDICMYVYGYYDLKADYCIKALIYNLRKKGLEIINRIKFGYKLITKINYF